MNESPLSSHLANTVAALKHLLRAQSQPFPRWVRPPRPVVDPPAPPGPSTATGPRADRPQAFPGKVLPRPTVVQGPPLPDDPWPGLDLAAIGELVKTCERCDLAATRTNTVFGEGAMNPPVMFIGEGPGADEDKAGHPFVGAAGQLLDKMIVAMGLQRQGCYITNVVKCRPPNNAAPRPDQAGPCLPYLFAQIRRVRPRIIVALGATAAKALLGKPDVSIGRERGRFHDLEGIPMLVTYHPAALLRNPGFKRPAWEDLKLVMTRLKSGEKE